jgi:hypothetical protein
LKKERLLPLLTWVYFSTSQAPGKLRFRRRNLLNPAI